MSAVTIHYYIKLRYWGTAVFFDNLLLILWFQKPKIVQNKALQNKGFPLMVVLYLTTSSTVLLNWFKINPFSVSEEEVDAVNDRNHKPYWCFYVTAHKPKFSNSSPACILNANKLVSLLYVFDQNREKKRLQQYFKASCR